MVFDRLVLKDDQPPWQDHIGRMLASYHWADGQTLVLMLKYVENIHHDLFTFRFSEEGLELSFGTSLAFNPDERPDLTALIIT